MANSSLHRHFHTHTKKLCRPPPKVVIAPPPCWPPRIPGKVQSRIVDYYGQPVCQSFEVFVAEKTGDFLFNCNYDFHYHISSYPGHGVRISFQKNFPAVTIYVELACSAYNSRSSWTSLYAINPGLSPHEYSLGPSDWTNPADRHLISRFLFTV